MAITKLTVKQRKIIAKTIVYHLIETFDVNATEESNLTFEEERKLCDEVNNIANKFKTDYIHIGSVTDIIEAVVNSKDKGNI